MPRWVRDTVWGLLLALGAATAGAGRWLAGAAVLVRRGSSRRAAYVTSPGGARWRG